MGQFRQFVEDSGYITAAERDGSGGSGWNVERHATEIGPRFNWREVGSPQTDSHPVANITWNDAKAFCEWMTRREDALYRLPTEAEWEFVATQGLAGSEIEPMGVANIADISLRVVNREVRVTTWDDHFPFTAPVGTFRPNTLGVYDLFGNIREWCEDWYSPEYPTALTTDPVGPAEGTQRVARGGSWSSSLWEVRSTSRSGSAPPHARSYALGFRVVREVRAKFN